jgi:tRNA (mo5U34)-methyltransferase
MARRGADYVLGIDTDPHYLEQARLAAELSGVKLDLKQLSVYDIGSLGQRFDLVIFMGVFYHLRHPLLALDLIRQHVADDLFLFQSMQRGSDELLSKIQHDYPFEETAVFEQDAFPKLHFLEQSYCADPTNWWIPNRACVEAMLRSSGFCILDRPEEEVYLCQTSKREHPYD